MTSQGLEVQPPAYVDSKVSNWIQPNVINNINLQVAMPVREIEVQSPDDEVSCKVKSVIN